MLPRALDGTVVRVLTCELFLHDYRPQFKFEVIFVVS